MMYGSHESTQAVEIGAYDSREVEFDIVMACTARGCSAQTYGEPGDCYPSEAPEFELDTIHVLDEHGNPHKITWAVFEAFVGAGASQVMFDSALIDAQESGDF